MLSGFWLNVPPIFFRSTETSLSQFQKFGKFEEIGFAKSPGSSAISGHHMDLGAFQEYLKKHFCQKIFPVLFNISWFFSKSLLKSFFHFRIHFLNLRLLFLNSELCHEIPQVYCWSKKVYSVANFVTFWWLIIFLNFVARSNNNRLAAGKWSFRWIWVISLWAALMKSNWLISSLYIVLNRSECLQINQLNHIWALKERENVTCCRSQTQKNFRVDWLATLLQIWPIW